MKTLKSISQKVTHLIFIQMSAKAWIRKHGEKAVAAVLKELTQLHVGAMAGKPVVVFIDPFPLTDSQK